jgi:hypothetical protein
MGITEQFLARHQYVGERVGPVRVAVEPSTASKVHPSLAGTLPANDVKRIEHQPDRRDVSEVISWRVEQMRDEQSLDRFDCDVFKGVHEDHDVLRLCLVGFCSEGIGCKLDFTLGLGDKVSQRLDGCSVAVSDLRAALVEELSEVAAHRLDLETGRPYDVVATHVV